ncbi:lactoylglutathione lyase [Mycobacterium sp. E1715]|uniref:VOC family protein n=1 Tax=unclassified Mycobacterium TaxID=2642494 RepID=UPI0007FD5CA9|nr:MULTISPECIES: VOC family protein [unclassified Mycobacterium]OBG63509.1 lactoylglutathione lyase [Mycobacterium sp. E188]OBG75299.1 lactoylglutathione lyase [Mycobacterium sp. E3305]OBH16294.1 lactoylglutathione lyase [Mycobacterium sp. E1715]OBH34195.1 lactoylglutathione lyase [Mycobacterium sp. E183]
MTPGDRLTHIGLCVSDLERSVRFYCTAMGFDESGRLTVDGPETARLLGVPGLVLDLVYLQRDGFRLELLGYPVPGVREKRRPRRMNAVGFTHLSFRVDDADAVVARIERLGGQARPERTVTFDGGNRGLMATDPDGNWIELIERTAPSD